MPYHLTTAGQTIESDYIYSLLTAPSQISLLAESAVQVGLARMATIQRQIDLSGQHRGPNGINVWASAGASKLSINNAPNFPTASGTPFGGTVGADYQLPGGVIVGAALTAGGQTQRFSTGGHFNQSGEALSLYAAYSAGPIWGNAIASYGLLQNHIARQVTLGMFTDQNSADTDGHSLALALRGGYDFKIGPFTTGPVAGAVLQQVRINGFTETGTSGVSALSFGSQTRGSAVSQLGWRGSVDLGDWQPFAEVAWNHEWANKNRTIVDVAHVDRGTVLVRRRSADRLRLGHRLARRLLQTQLPGDPPRHCFGLLRQPAGFRLRGRTGPERRLLNQPLLPTGCQAWPMRRRRRAHPR